MPKMTDLPFLPASSLSSKFLLISSRLLIFTSRRPIPKRRKQRPHSATHLLFTG